MSTITTIHDDIVKTETMTLEYFKQYLKFTNTVVDAIVDDTFEAAGVISKVVDNGRTLTHSELVTAAMAAGHFFFSTEQNFITNLKALEAKIRSEYSEVTQQWYADEQIVVGKFQTAINKVKDFFIAIEQAVKNAF